MDSRCGNCGTEMFLVMRCRVCESQPLKCPFCPTLRNQVKELEEKLKGALQLNDFLRQDHRRMGEAIEWASNKGVFDHFEHPISDKEWEYFVTELHRRASDIEE